MKKIIKRLKFIFKQLRKAYLHETVLSKQFTNRCNLYWNMNENFNQQFITNIFAEKNKEGYILTIITHRPGILIGKGAENIDNLSTFLVSEFGKPVKIHLEEPEMFMYKRLKDYIPDNLIPNN